MLNLDVIILLFLLHEPLSSKKKSLNPDSEERRKESLDDLRLMSVVSDFYYSIVNLLAIAASSAGCSAAALPHNAPSATPRLFQLGTYQ